MAFRELFDRLTFRFGLMLTLAFLPIGLMSVSATRQLADDENRRAEATLLALTAEAAAGEGSFLRAGLIVASTLAATVAVLREDSASCTRVFARFVADNPDYAFAGYETADGRLLCGSAALGADLSDAAFYGEMRSDPRARIELASTGRPGAAPGIVLAQPVFDRQGAFDGFVALSLPNEHFGRLLAGFAAQQSLELVTFAADGTVLSVEGNTRPAGPGLPEDRTLAELGQDARSAFTGRATTGERRIFAVVPIMEGRLYAMGSLETSGDIPFLESFFPSPLRLAILMWLVSLSVAYLAVHRLAIRNLAALRQRMRTFTATHRFEKSATLASKPVEFREIEQTWEEMAETVVREEAELENTIHSRDVLLKEVHHRVKNNLQLIASIVSMKTRKATSPEARAVLKEVQSRVMSIATVHRALYLTSTVGRVQADELLRGIVEKTIEAELHPAAGIRIETSYDPVPLYPDQAVPLSLLASEALTNSLKYTGRPADGSEPWIALHLRRVDAHTAQFEIANSCGAPVVPLPPVPGTGLGTSLIAAFAQQLGGRLDPLAPPDGCRIVRMRFPIVGFDEAATGDGIADFGMGEPHPRTAPEAATQDA